jgi:hypothetical protein
MKVGKIVLAVLLAGAAFAAYKYFPNPLAIHEAAAKSAAPAQQP